jgi:LuxR family maltose regulon positive regulatory protein
LRSFPYKVRVTTSADQPTGHRDAPAVLVTKLHPPVVPAAVVHRERLFDRLRAGRGRRLTLVACPAGFGKSTLLAAWREHEAAACPVAWVTLDDGDDDAVVLWSHVIEALCRACPALRERDLDTSGIAAPVREVVLPRLVNELAEQGDVVLILDDVHRLTSAAARDGIAWFVDHAPATTQVVLATRADPALPIGALRAHGELLEVRADDLRFTTAEAEEFLNGRLGLALAAADVELLVARTEGWPAGLYLAALSLDGREDKSAMVHAFDGTAAHVVDFLSTEVLSAYDPELQRFMLHTSVLERLCADLCDAVLGTSGSGEVLERLARSNLFLLPLDDHRRWFRFHHLFAQLLRVELERREPEQAPALHRRAAAWHAASGTTDEAVHHALAAGAHDEAGALVAAAWVHYVNAGRTSSVLDWLARFPGEVVDAHGELLLVQAWVSALRGREHDMRRAIGLARERADLEAGPLPDGFSSLASSISVLSAAFGWGDVRVMLQEGARAAAREDLASPWRPVVSWSLGWGHYCAGDLAAAERWLAETTQLAPAADQWVVGTGAIADLSMLAGFRGDRAEQLRLALEAVDQAQRTGLLEACEVGEVHTAYGCALLAHGRPAEALPELEQGVFLRRIWGQPLDLLDGLIALAPAVAAIGDRTRAEALFREAEELAARCPDPGVLPERLREARRAALPAVASGPLSERELSVLRLLSGGMSEREVASELVVSFNTVHSHVKAVYRKLGASSRAQAVERARREGLLP